MRLELHDAALAPEPPAGCKDGNKPDKVQRSGLSGGLRGALRSLSSATLKVRNQVEFGDISRSTAGSDVFAITHCCERANQLTPAWLFRSGRSAAARRAAPKPPCAWTVNW